MQLHRHWLGCGHSVDVADAIKRETRLAKRTSAGVKKRAQQAWRMIRARHDRSGRGPAIPMMPLLPYSSRL
jgi:hypothetical protein